MVIPILTQKLATKFRRIKLFLKPPNRGPLFLLADPLFLLLSLDLAQENHLSLNPLSRNQALAETQFCVVIGSLSLILSLSILDFEPTMRKMWLQPARVWNGGKELGVVDTWQCF